MRFGALLAVFKLIGNESLLGFSCWHWRRTEARELVSGGEQNEVAVEAISKKKETANTKN